MKTFDGHETVTLGELKEDGTKNILIKKTSRSTCKVHEEEMKIYCFDCDHLICRDCIVFDHRDHTCEFVKKAVPEIREKITKHLVPLNKIHMNLHDAAMSVKSTKSDIETQSAFVAATIERQFDELHFIIEQRKQELLEKASSITKVKLDRLSIQGKGFEMALGGIRSLVDFVEQNMKNATDEELMSIHTQVLSRIDEETRKHQQSSTVLEPVEEADMGVEVGCVEEIRKLCLEKTKITTAVYCTVEAPVNKNAEVSKSIKVHTFFTLTESVRRLSVEAKLTSSLDGSAVKTMVQQKQRNSFEIEYIPKVRGRHNLEVTANGLPLKGSPFPVFVKIPPTQLCKPLRVIGGVKTPLGVAINSAEEVIVTERDGGVVILDKRGKKLRGIEKSECDFRDLSNVVVDKEDNMYVTDRGSKKIFKFNKNCELLNVVGGLADIDPVAATVVGQVVVVLGYKQPLGIFTRNLDLIRKVDSGCHAGCGIAHDIDGNLYICDYLFSRILILNIQGEFLNSFGDEDLGPGELQSPDSICVHGGLVYVSDRCCVSVFTKEGNLVTSFGGLERKEDHFKFCPTRLAVDADGVLYVCDLNNDQLQLF